MKRIHWFFYTIFSLGIITSCDEVDDPYEHLDEFITDTGDSRFNDTVMNDANLSSRVILIEDFTGHKCPNCPAATDLGKQLVDDNPGQVFVVAIHNSGNFSETDDKFTVDYETEAGENLRVEFQISSFPAGLIDRQEWNNSFRVGMGQWENNVNTKLQDPDYMELNFRVNSTNIYNSDSRILRVVPNVTALDNVSGEIYFVVYILENGIVSPQEDSRFPNETPIKDYVHNHLLRASFPLNEIGIKIFENPNSGDQYMTEFQSMDELRFELKPEWVDQNCEVAYVIYNRTSKEVLHFEIMPLMNSGG